ncbi:MAG: rhomboid family intramembrane serine protease [Acidobacteria bacterium]|nr:rhomboid family intramembrane serine protease [Acidobacteriota bacterium]
MVYRTNRSTFGLSFGPGLTPGVKQLLIANIAVYVLASLLIPLGFGRPFAWLVLNPYSVTHDFYVWQLVTYMFLHQPFPTLFHILFNMFALWMFGSDLERTWGTRRFFMYYFVCGIGAGLTAIVLASSPVMGASGAIYGILLAYGMMFPDRMIFLYFLIPIKAKYFVMIMAGIEFMSQLTLPGSAVSHMAHLGGMAFGFAYLRGKPLLFDLNNRYYRWRRARLQRAFKVYVNKRDREEQRKGPWVH